MGNTFMLVAPLLLVTVILALWLRERPLRDHLHPTALAAE
jgi:hypothetical protein